MDQTHIFLHGAADGWWSRNADLVQTRAWDRDPVVESLARIGRKPERVLEIGCADGGRLAHLNTAWQCEAVGIDPSEEAVCAGRRQHPALDLRRGTHRDVGPDLGSFDLVILGFCLYLIPREDLFRLTAAVDEVLRVPGFLTILDFDPGRPQRRPYVHTPGVTSWKTDHSALFRANPQYLLLDKHVFAHGDGDTAEAGDRVSATTLRKLTPEQAYGDDPAGR